MWEDGSESDGNNSNRPTASYTVSELRSQRGNSRGSTKTESETSGDSNKLRWGRSNFSHDEIQALESPLRDVSSSTSVRPGVFEEDSDAYSHSRDTPIFLSNDKTRASRDVQTPQTVTDGSPRTVNNFQTAARISLIILPAIFFAAAAHFINGIMTDFKLFSASFSVFQGVFWPSFIFLVIDLLWWRNPSESEDDAGDYETGCAGLSCNRGKWKRIIILLVHGNLAGIAMIMLLLSIQRLNISVSLALSFSPEVYVILLSFINRERKFSLELILFAVMTYTGFLIVGIPAMFSRNHRMAEGLTTGLVAALGSMTLAVPASFALGYLRKERVADSLIAVSFAFHGSLFSWITKIIMGSTMDMTFDPISVGWAAGLIALIVCGTLLLFLGAKFRQVGSAKDTYARSYSSISQMRMFVFIFSSFWEIVRQGMWHTFPGIYDIFGSLLVVLGYLLAVGFEAWTFEVSEEVKLQSLPFKFFPWLFSRTLRGNYSSS